MATQAEAVRSDLLVLAAEASAATTALTAGASSPQALRAALFDAVPAVVDDYASAAAELAALWFEELREDAAPRGLYVPRPIVAVTENALDAMVASITADLRDAARIAEAEVEQMMADVMRDAEAIVEKSAAEAFRDTITGNTADDPDAVGWRRYARPEACKFCLMLAAKGAIYTETTARFAAHGAVMGGNRKGGNCMCTAGPSWDADAPRATSMQYLASKRGRSAEEREALRDYLNQKYPDAPG